MREIKISMGIKNFDKEKQINTNEVYYTINADKKELNNLLNRFGKNIKIIEIDCKKCKNAKSLWQEYDNKGLLPPYFGNNWDAFYDSIFYFEFFEQYDLLVLILNDFEYFMEEEQIKALSIYKKIKESLAFKIGQKKYNRPSLTYIFNANEYRKGPLFYIETLYRNTERTVVVPVYRWSPERRKWWASIGRGYGGIDYFLK